MQTMNPGIYQMNFKVSEVTGVPATRVLLNDGKGIFSAAGTKALPAVSNGDLFAGDEVLLGDLDGDDAADIVLTGNGSSLRDPKAPEYVKGSKTRILMNDGKGTFENVTGDDFPGVKKGDDWGGVALALGDVDGDDDVDLVLSTPSALVDESGISPVHLPSTRLFLGSASGFSEAGSGALPAVSQDGEGDMLRATDVVLVDVEGDGTPDLLLIVPEKIEVDGEQVSSTRFLKGDGKGSFEDATAKTLPLTGKDRYLGHALVLGDVDGDDDLDLILTTTLSGYTSAGAYPTRLLKFR
jgi:hypothetical protein